MLQGAALPAIAIETREFYATGPNTSPATRYRTLWSGVGAEAALARAALATFAAVGAQGWGRVDFIAGGDGVPLLLEVNTVPGMTGHSLVPMAAAAVGIDFAELAWRVLETSFARSRCEPSC